MEEVWYRFQEGYDRHVMLCRLPVVKHTPGGVWLDATSRAEGGVWVSKWTKKRYAYPDIQSAAESYMIRKHRQVFHCLNTLFETLGNINAMKTRIDLDLGKFGLGLKVIEVLDEVDCVMTNHLKGAIPEDEFYEELGEKINKFRHSGTGVLF